MSKKKASIDHLSAEAKAFFRAVSTEFQIEDPAGCRILLTAAEAMDRAEKARKIIDADGMIVAGRDSQLKQHPLLSAERDARAQFLMAIKQLHLDLEPVSQVGRPPGR
jgi:P27 family predicted phage terminase small subunit